jgi:general secretion pathway protein F
LANLPFKRQARLSSKQLKLFTRQLSSLAQVSPLEEALRTISRQSEQPQLRQILTDVHAGRVEGQRLSEAMRGGSNSFRVLYRAIIAAGERAGTRPLITDRLAVLLEQRVKCAISSMAPLHMQQFCHS